MSFVASKMASRLRGDRLKIAKALALENISVLLSKTACTKISSKMAPKLRGDRREIAKALFSENIAVPLSTTVCAKIFDSLVGFAQHQVELVQHFSLVQHVVDDIEKDICQDGSDVKQQSISLS